MARNGSSVYSLPAGNPVIPGTTIATTWANTTMTDIANALTQSLSTDGSTASVSLAGKTMTGGTYTTMTTNGLLTLNGGQIAFPATQIPSANANTLDDYEEGTWTPTLTCVTPGDLNVGYSTRTGRYTKIGRMVMLSVEIQASTYTFTTATGALSVSGAPFTAVGNFPGGTVYSDNIKSTNPGTVFLLMAGTTLSIYISQITVGTGTTSPAAIVANTATTVLPRILATCSYETST